MATETDPSNLLIRLAEIVNEEVTLAERERNLRTERTQIVGLLQMWHAVNANKKGA